MKKKKTFRVGDKIVDFGQVFRIFKIKKGKIFFRPYYKTQKNKDLEVSVPIANLQKTHIRKPISGKKFKRLLKKLSPKRPKEIDFNTSQARKVLNFNDPSQTVQVLKNLWRDKNDPDKSFTKTKKDLFKLAVKRLSEETAFLGNISVDEAKQKIKKLLNPS